MSGIDHSTIVKYVRQYDTNNIITNPSRLLTSGTASDDIEYYASQRSWNGTGYLCHRSHPSLSSILEVLFIRLRSISAQALPIGIGLQLLVLCVSTSKVRSIVFPCSGHYGRHPRSDGLPYLVTLMDIHPLSSYPFD